ncbi:MAG: hypothetical protein AAB709_02155 [Patescibacteria group bacterium]
MNSPNFEHLHSHVSNEKHEKGNYSVVLTHEQLSDLEKTLSAEIENIEGRIDALNNLIDEGRVPNSANARAEVEKLEEELSIKNGIVEKLLGGKVNADVT